MSTKISALTAAIAGNVTDATVLPLVDSTVTTVKVTIAQLRTQLAVGNQTFLNNTTITQSGNGSEYVTDGRFRFSSATGLAFAAATIYQSAGAGLTIASATGASNDFTLTTPAGGTICKVPTGTTTLSFSGLVTIASTVASAAGTGTDIVFGATTQTTIGANGAATALTANPLGYLVFYKGTTKCILPYYNG